MFMVFQPSPSFSTSEKMSISLNVNFEAIVSVLVWIGNVTQKG